MQFIEAPQLLKELAQNIEQLQKTRIDITNKDSKVKKLKNLRERYETLKQQIDDEGIERFEKQTAENVNETKPKTKDEIIAEAIETAASM